jgi:hypothetical protein
VSSKILLPHALTSQESGGSGVDRPRMTLAQLVEKPPRRLKTGVQNPRVSIGNESEAFDEFPEGAAIASKLSKTDSRPQHP